MTNTELNLMNSNKYREVFIETDVIGYYHTYKEEMLEDFFPDISENYLTLITTIALMVVLRTEVGSFENSLDGERAMEMSELFLKLVAILKNSTKLSFKNTKEFFKSIPKKDYITFLATFALMVAFRNEFFLNGFRLRKFRIFINDHLLPHQFDE